MMLENTRMLHLRTASPLIGKIKEVSTGSVGQKVSDGPIGKDVPPTSIDKEIRNTSPDRPERSFHILYYLLAKGHPALDEKTVRELYLKTMRAQEDLSGYEHVNKAMRTIAGPDSRIPEISWNAIAAVALLMAAKNFADPRVERAYETLGNPNLKELRTSISEAAVKDDAHRDDLERAELYPRSKALYLCIFDVSRFSFPRISARANLTDMKTSRNRSIGPARRIVKEVIRPRDELCPSLTL
jgi:hypothetical protein